MTCPKCSGWPGLFLALSLLTPTVTGAAATWVREAGEAGDFPLVHDGIAAAVCFSPDDHRVVAIACDDLARDIERVTGVRAEITHKPGSARFVVLAGTLESSPLIDELAASGRLDLGELADAWESFVITTVDNPVPGVDQALVIAGSDRRGTAFGIYELARAIGVSPWHWWADVTPTQRSALFVASGPRRFGPPSVKYRGIFLNDEDWGLHPWAAKTFDPELGDIGPKTYRKVFELLLRLKANTLWPAMHEVTRAFNLYPENARLADEYAIVMGSSHAEPMLRNNVTEWRAPPEQFNYITHRDQVRAYWEERVRTNAAFENSYTLGMRGIHDSGMVGAASMPERIAALEQIFADQRAMLARHVDPQVENLPQVFTPYKEVLDIYRAGLRVPEDVTLVWPDDNHGYIRHFPTPEERERRGGSGAYYHLSYLGAPLAYLWLYTTPPAVVWEEMTKAYDLGARTLWIANVGDLKPAELGTDFFLQLAWDVSRWRRENLPNYFEAWAREQIDPAVAPDIASVLRGYFELNFQRRPEHLQWWLPHTRVRPSTLTPEEIAARLAAFDALVQKVESLRQRIPRHRRDAFFELVEYPVRGSALANARYFHAERYTQLFNADPIAARRHGAEARRADHELAAITTKYNEEVAGGKWRHFMAVEPADGMWRSFRLTPPILPAENMAAPARETASATHPQQPAAQADNTPSASAPGAFGIEAEAFTAKRDRHGVAWEIVPGLGRTGDAVTIFPRTAPSIDLERLRSDAPALHYALTLPRAGEFTVHVNLLPTHPLVDGQGLRFALGLDDGEPVLVVIHREVGDAMWSQSVLNATITGTATLAARDAGPHTLNLYMVDAGVVPDKLIVDCGGLTPSYLGPGPAAHE